jgi:hypothetical protein
MRHLTDDIVLTVKDAMRNLRYAIRSEATSPATRTESLAEAGAIAPPSARRRNRVARLVDKVFTEVESGTLAFVSPGREGARGLRFPRPVCDYFGLDPRRDEAAELIFARGFYRAVKGLLRGFGLSNMLIFEHAIGRARDEVVQCHGELVRHVLARLATPSEGRADRIRICAHLTASLVAARPIKEVDLSLAGAALPRGLAASPNAYCFAVLGLATAIASVSEEAADAEAVDILASANSVVDLRFQRFAEAFEAEDPAEALAREFDEVLPFLP